MNKTIQYNIDKKSIENLSNKRLNKQLNSSGVSFIHLHSLFVWASKMIFFIIKEQKNILQKTWDIEVKVLLMRFHLFSITP